MKYTKASISGTYEILAADEFVAIPMTLKADAKAGAPIKADGSADTTGANAVGILLYDVKVDENPVAAVVVQGVIDLAKAKAHSGVSGMTATALKAVPGIVCRENIGVNA